jgi:xanthine dehydrogenase YagS FAD-binding subunit
VDERQYLPLRRIPEHRRRRAVRRRAKRMNAFRYAQAHDAASALATMESDAGAAYIAGGTNVVDLMKDDVVRPTLLIDITRLPMRGIDALPGGGVRLGALATMSEVADHPAVVSGFPVVAQSLLLSASPQLRNMATIGGNVMQRTRCAYFRDVSQACNKRAAGTGCAAIAGVNRQHAVVGGSAQCICTHPSDLAVALLTVDAIVHVRGRSRRSRHPDRPISRSAGYDPAAGNRARTRRSHYRRRAARRGLGAKLLLPQSA